MMVDCPQRAQRDRVIAAQRHDPGAGREEACDISFDGRECLGDREWVRTDIATVDHLLSAPRLCIQCRVEGAEQSRGLAYCLRPEARAWPIRRSGVERHPEDRDVRLLYLAALGQSSERPESGIAGNLP